MQHNRKVHAFYRSHLEPSAALNRRTFLAHGSAAAAAIALPAAAWADVDRSQFKRIPTEYIAALAPPDATSGDNAETWGLWRQDPGPRGLRLKNYDRVEKGVAPAGWNHDQNAWWLEEHGLLMEAPEFPMPAGTYLVTGDRDVTSVLTVQPASADRPKRLDLADGATQ
jgi:hypothetical protein